MSDLFIILGNQLFDPKHLSKYKKNKIFMCEDLGLCSYEKHHKLKILQFLSSMRSYRDLLIKKGFSVDYYDCQNNFEKKYEDKLEKSIKKHKIDKVKEFTIEANPGEASQKRLKNFLKLGINRLSIGVQSLDNDDLKNLGRTHTAELAIKAIGIAQRYFDSVSIDLIYLSLIHI